MTERKLIELSHSMIVRCSGVTAKPPASKLRTERVFTAQLYELDEMKAGLAGAAALKDIPHDLARQLSEGLSPNRKYELSFTLREVPEKQRSLFDEDAADAEARAEAGAGAGDEGSITTVSITHKGSTVTATPKQLRSALDRVKRTHRARSH